MTADILIIALLAAAVFFAVRKIIKDRKAGIGSCGENCSECIGTCKMDYDKIPDRFKLKKQ